MKNETKKYRFENSTQKILKLNAEKTAYEFFGTFFEYGITGKNRYKTAVKKIEYRNIFSKKKQGEQNEKIRTQKNEA